MTLFTRLIISFILTVVSFNFSAYKNTTDLFDIKPVLVFLVLEIIATYTKICLGFFQVAAIVILTLQVWRKYTDQLDAISFWLYFGISIWNGCLVIGCVVFISYIGHCLSKPDTENPQCYKATDKGVIFNAVAFMILSITLLIVVIPLFKSLRDLRSGNMQLTYGVQLLASIFAIFTFCYVTRTIYDLTVEVNLQFGNLFSGIALPLIWDGVPISMMLFYHFKNMTMLKQA